MGLVIAAVPFEGNWYFDTLLDGVRRAVEAEGHEVVVEVRPFGRAGRGAVTDLFDRHLADPACIGAVAGLFKLLPEQAARVSRHGKPVVLVGGPHPDLPTVRLDDVAVARQAVEHLVGLGHRGIAHVAGYAVTPDDFAIRTDRVRGYSDAMRAAGLESLSQVLPSEFDVEAARRHAVGLLRQPQRPTAVFAVVDEIAFGVLAAAEDLGLRVPDDLSVIGVDDHRDSAGLGLTTMRQRPAESGAAAAARILGRTTDDDQVLGTELVVRTSTAPPAGARKRRFPFLGRTGR